MEMIYMNITYKNKVYESKYDAKTNTVEVTEPDDDILEVLYDDRIQRGLLYMYDIINDEKMFQDCVTKILDLDEYDLVNLIKNIMDKHPSTMKTILKY